MAIKVPRSNPFDVGPLTPGRRAIVRASALHDVVLATVEGLVGRFDDAKNLVGVGAAPGGAMTAEVVRLVLDQQLERLTDGELSGRVTGDARVYLHLCNAVRSFRRARRGERWDTDSRNANPLTSTKPRSGGFRIPDLGGSLIPSIDEQPPRHVTASGRGEPLDGAHNAGVSFARLLLLIEYGP
jgi:hypothetical protein